MLTPEETKVLDYLRTRAGAATAEVARVCLPGASPDWLARILSNLDWLGYLITFPDADGNPAFLQLISKADQCGSAVPLPVG